MIKGLLKPAENKGALVKKVKASKFISKPKESDKKGSALAKKDYGPLIIRPKISLAPRVASPNIPKVKEPTGKVGFDYLNNLLDSLIKNTSNLLKVSKSDYKDEVKDAESKRRSSQLEAKRTREERFEEGKKDKERLSGLKIAAPKLPLFDSALEFLKRFAIGTAVMQVLSIFSDPKKKNSLIGFLTNNLEVIILGVVGVMGALLLAPLTPLLGAFGILFNITAAIIGSLVSLLLNPAILPILGTVLAAGAIVVATAQPAGQHSQLTGPNAVWKDPRLNPTSRKAIIESTFEHMPYNTWPQEAKELYEKDLRSLGIPLKEAQDSLREKVKMHSQQSRQIQQQQSQFKFPEIFGTESSSVSQPQSRLIPQSSLPALPPTGIDPIHGPAQMYGASRPGGRKHAGQDFDAGPNDTFYSRIGGEVIYADNAGGGYGNVVDVYNADLNHTERIAEGDVNLVKVGDTISPGTPVQRGTNQTGVFHYEIRKGRATASGSFAGTVDPIEFLNSLQDKSTAQIATTTTTGQTSTTSVSQYASYEEPKRQAALIPISMPQQQAAGKAGGSTSIISESPSPYQVLNTYYNFQVLGFLYKQG